MLGYVVTRPSGPGHGGRGRPRRRGRGLRTRRAAPPPSPPPAPAGCDAAGQPTPTVQAPVAYAVVVAPYGSPTHEVTSFTATSVAAKNADVASLQRSGTVLAVEPNQVVRATSDPPVTTGAYPSFSLQWGLQGPPGGDFAPAWNTFGYSGRGITVAVVDSGVDLDHSGLAGHVIAGPDFFTDASGATPVSPSLPGHGDPFGHGTHVAGIIADNDPSGGLGGAPNATILAVRVLGPDGSGSTLTVAQGIEWAASHGANVINLSLGEAGCDSVIQTAVTDAHHEGVVIAAAAGNDASSELFSPAGYSNEVIGVAAIDPGSGALAAFSNWGGYVSLAAPGVDVLSTCAYTGCIAPSTPSDTAYGYLDGTSMAAPFVERGRRAREGGMPELHPRPGPGRAREPCRPGRPRLRVPPPRRRAGGRRRLPLIQPGGASPGQPRRTTGLAGIGGVDDPSSG